ncbi:tetratricopeptide repeat protein [Sabulilitoribacter multivorans]|uniref:Tetratricopeptide repeat protein n=1 Tax=Flaviramulus multivorans TaxID=1304750 RepID=A0ABS9II39_9FLAO|nr:tetratricopeptide repeat protein [Flaviramulus multivorans]MCF7560238.1 tetratricopeptide repeat protein [Flaviramulus multivorans]
MKKVFLILSLVPLTLFSQTNHEIDSLLNVYNNLSDNADKVYILDRLHYATLYNDVKSAKKYALDMLNLATKLKETEEIGYANYNIGVSYRILGQKDSAVIYFKKAKTIFETKGYSKGESLVNSAFATLALESGNHVLAMELTQKNISIARANKDSSNVGVSYKFLGFILREKGDLEKALDYCFSALKLLTDPYFKLERADTFSEIGRIEYELGNYESANKYQYEAKAIYEEENDLEYLAQSLKHIGTNYYNLKAYDQAEKNFNEALQLARKIPSPTIEGLTLLELGKTHMQLNQPNKALNYLRTAMDFGEKNDRIMDVILASYQISDFYYKQNNMQMAMKYANDAIKLADSVKLPNMLSLSYELRSNIYKKGRSYGPALEDFTTFKMIQDSLYHIEKAKEIEKLKAIYETEKKELQIAQQETAISLLEQEARINKLQKILLGGGLVLSLLLFGLGLYAIRQKMKRNRLEKERVKAELDFKKKELTTHALHLAKKNEVLENLKQQAKTLKANSKESKGYQDLIKTINFDQQDDKNWENFTQYFEQVHKDFSSNVKLKYPEVTKNELRFMALIKMNMSSKEIATILNISADGVKKARQRLRKKMDLTPQDSLENAVLAI